MVLSNIPTRRKCGTEEEISVYILCECEALAALRHTNLGSLFMDPEDFRKPINRISTIWNCGKGTGLLKLIMGNGGTEGLFKVLGVSDLEGFEPMYLH
jgi:hypothetical protein